MSRFRPGSCSNPVHQIHLYVDDGTKDHRGNSRCGWCGLPARNRLHQVPERTAEQRQDEARRVGESA